MTERPDESVLAYIGYATVAQIWSATKIALIIFAVMGTIGVVFTVGTDWIFGAAESALGAPTFSLPKWMWPPIAFCGALWFFRGQTIPIPKLTFREWLFISIVIMGSGLLDTVLPSWGAALSFSAIMSGLYMVETLNENGKKNYARLQDQS